ALAAPVRPVLLDQGGRERAWSGAHPADHPGSRRRDSGDKPGRARYDLYAECSNGLTGSRLRSCKRREILQKRTMADGEEKRRAAREPVALFVEYEGADDLVCDFTENLSSGGTFVTTNRTLPVGTLVQLVLSFPGLLEPIAIEGTVRWTRGNSAAGDAGAGIECEPGPSRDAMAAVVDRIRKGDPQIMARQV